MGRARLEPAGSAQRLLLSGASSRGYSNAQIDDYQGTQRRSFPWRPPLRLTVRARFSHSRAGLRGTAGFGFWNDPFLMTNIRLPALPRAAWFFFASPPSDMKLAMQVPGHGWKAAVIDALRPASLLLAPAALPAALLMNVRPLYRRLWPPIQRALNVAEALLDVEMRDWQTYLLEWGPQHARFTVSGERVLEAPAPRGPLGFVLWMDNQYLVATPWGRLRYGRLNVPGEQWMDVEHLSIEPL
ncbi:MAG: hypothetical protein EHM56_11700 [Chloroflexi bacterium]|nr:MAG: hypothetical protein EHM56_11700 [Chloroflexota bacterium]